MSYPVKITQQSFDHKGGTKSYHFTMIEAASGNCVVIFRYGKKGQFGQLIVETFNSSITAWKHYNKKEDEKSGSRGGYSPVGGRVEKEITDASKLSVGIGVGLFNKMGKDAVNHIDSSFDTSKMRGLDIPTLDEEGRSVGDTSRKADLSELMAQQKLEEQARAEATYADNEAFGAF